MSIIFRHLTVSVDYFTEAPAFPVSVISSIRLFRVVLADAWISCIHCHSTGDPVILPLFSDYVNSMIIPKRQWLSCITTANLRTMDSVDSGTTHELNYGFRILLTQFVSFYFIFRNGSHWFNWTSKFIVLPRWIYFLARFAPIDSIFVYT